MSCFITLIIRHCDLKSLSSITSHCITEDRCHIWCLSHSGRNPESKRYDKQTRHSVCHRTRNDNLLCLLRAPGDGEIEAFQALPRQQGYDRERERERERERSRGKWINGIIFTLWGRQSFLLYFIFPWPLHPILHTHDTTASISDSWTREILHHEMWMIRIAWCQ